MNHWTIEVYVNINLEALGENRTAQCDTVSSDNLCEHSENVDIIVEVKVHDHQYVTSEITEQVIIVDQNVKEVKEENELRTDELAKKGGEEGGEEDSG